jgi:hypothetical protein
MTALQGAFLLPRGMALTALEIKGAYKKYVLQNHPDKVDVQCEAQSAAFARCLEAFKVLVLYLQEAPAAVWSPDAQCFLDVPAPAEVEARSQVVEPEADKDVSVVVVCSSSVEESVSATENVGKLSSAASPAVDDACESLLTSADVCVAELHGGSAHIAARAMQNEAPIAEGSLDGKYEVDWASHFSSERTLSAEQMPGHARARDGVDGESVRAVRTLGAARSI